MAQLLPRSRKADQNSEAVAAVAAASWRSIEKMTDQLNLTPDQKAKVQPIIDQLKPQIESIRREAMEKSKAVMDNAMSQIRPLLTPEQQKKLEEAKNDRKSGREGGGRHGRHGQGGQEDDGDDVGDQ